MYNILVNKRKGDIKIMAKTITKKEQYANLYAIVENSTAENKLDLLSFIDHEVELLEKKSSKTKLTIQQKANLKILDTIRGIMAENNKAVTISELIKTEPLKNFTNQKISALMRKLIESGEVEKTQIKKVSYFKLKN